MIFVRQYGSVGGRSIVGLHGWGGDHREFAAVAARLPAGFRLLSPDLPGYGDSPRPERWDVEAILDAVEKTLAVLRGRSPVLWRVSAVVRRWRPYLRAARGWRPGW